MNVTNQVIEFIKFTGIGIILAIIFDFFRAYRKFKKPTNSELIIQDILYFSIATIIIIVGIINILESSIRFYVILAMIVGIVIHAYKISKYTIRLFMAFFKVSRSIFEFFNITIAFYKQIVIKIVNLLQKLVEKYCKKFFYVVSLNWKSYKKLHKNVSKKTKKQKKKNLKEVNNENEEKQSKRKEKNKKKKTRN